MRLDRSKASLAMRSQASRVSAMIAIAGISHIGIRVVDAARSEAFYALFGFEAVWRGGEDNVVILKDASGVEINLIVNGVAVADGKNVLMDTADKHPGYTHVALRVESMEETVASLARANIAISGGPMRLGPGISLFIRDPDRNVLELRQELLVAG
jgi:lactoylglutathione lyase